MLTGKQSLQYKEAPHTVEEPFQAISNAYHEYKPEQIEENSLLYKIVWSVLCGFVVEILQTPTYEATSAKKNDKFYE